MLDFIDTSKKLSNRGKTPISQPGKERPLENHAYAKFLREVQGMSWKQISEEMGIPERTLFSWHEKEGWAKKGECAVELEDFTRKKFMELASRQGMPKERAVQLLVQGMTEPSMELVREEIDDKGKPVATKKILPDFATRHKYQKDYWVLVGLYSTNKQMEFNNSPEGTINVQVIIPEKTG